MIRIRRGTLSILPSNPNVFNLSNIDYQNTYIPILGVQDFYNYYDYIALPFSINDIVLVNLNESDPFLNWSFSKEGNYSILFEGHAEYCSEMEDKINQDVYFCKLSFRYYILVTDNELVEKNLHIIFIVMAFVIFTFISILILLLIYNYKGCPVTSDRNSLHSESIISPFSQIFRRMN